MTNIRYILKTALVLVAFGTTAALAQDSLTDEVTASATIQSTNILSVTNGSTVDFGTLTLADGSASAEATVNLSYETNDGNVYDIIVNASTGGWTTAPESASTMPALNLLDAAEGAVKTILISDAGALLDGTIATGLQNVEGTATANLSVSASQAVVAGAYSTALTFTLQ